MFPTQHEIFEMNDWLHFNKFRASLRDLADQFFYHL